MSKLAQQLIEKEKKEKKGILDLGNCGLTDLDAQVPELFDLVWLKKLVLSNRYVNHEKGEWTDRANRGEKNKLDRISKNFQQLSSLERLYIGGDEESRDRWNIQKIENLPQSIHYLDINYNEIENVQKSLSVIIL